MPTLPKKSTAIAGLKSAPGAAQTEFRDRDEPGLSLVVGAATKTWFYTYRAPDGRRKRAKLGRYPAVGLAAARGRARGVQAALHDDLDPSAIRRAYRATPTVKEIAERYLATHAARKATGRTDTALMRNDVFPLMGDRKIVDIRRRDVQAVIARILERGSPFMANRAVEILAKFFSWAIEQGELETSPAAGVMKPTGQRPRERVLTADEIKRLWLALDKLSPQAAGALKILLLTGQREMEVLGARRDEIQLDKLLWTLPANAPGRSKARYAPHVVPLAPMAADIFAGLLEGRQGSATVFGGQRRTGGLDGPTRGLLAKAKVRLDSGLFPTAEPWRIHDLRRTMRTGLSEIGVAPHIAELTIGHATGGLIKVYDRFVFLAEKRDALNRWAEHVAVLVGEKPGSENVVPLVAAGG